ncbi:lipopolysaccharide export LptBFGC system permease protein LptF [Gracilibacillus halotolerans]|uniref:Lipopolysaccharide export LptBFGC system permease protein LptF n=1 Tax=Gracilibacillus halotolerans TaxID=74386 RepID=A0A841RSG5_9BACI|nr:hypothetical protein [Gracilibacillus halotolerans]MBB6513518.1 lipopolysaccharide export LptBFGC system permease protein LptF [Gracilibacillus halotolerans]
MAQATVIIWAVLTVLVVILNVVFGKAKPAKSFATYIPGAVVFFVGLVFLTLSSSMSRVEILGAGFGGWGIACLMAATTALLITAVYDSNRHQSA